MSTANLSMKINNLKELLTQCRLDNLASLADTINIANNSVFRIAVVGETLKGKSTVINKLLCHDALPTGVIPSSNPLMIKYGTQSGISTAKESFPYNKSTLLTLLEEEQDNTNGAVLVSYQDEWLEKSGVEIFETVGLNVIQDENDLFAMTDILNCDGVVFVVSAEQLFSVNEATFIEQYLKTVSSNLIVVISKFDLIPMDECEKVIEYAKQKVKSSFADIPCFILNNNNNYIHKYKDNFFDAKTIKDVLAGWKNNTVLNESRSKKNEMLLSTIEMGFNNYINTITASRSQEETSINGQKEAMEAVRELATIKMEKIVLEIDNRQLSRVKSFANSTDVGINKIYNDVKPQLKTNHNSNTGIIEQTLVKLATELDTTFERACLDDIQWINDMIYTEYGFTAKPASVQAKLYLNESDFNENEKIDIAVKDYSNVKKYAPIGIAGAVAIGYFAFKIVGALLCFGGGLGFYMYINNKLDAQTIDVEKSVENSLRNMGRTIKGMSEKEITSVYSDIKCQYKQEMQAYIDGKYTADFGLSEKREEDIQCFETMVNNVISIIHQLKKELNSYVN